jgi:hypothetical protein
MQHKKINKENILPLIVAAAFIYGLFICLWLTQSINEMRGFIVQPAWINWARLTVYFSYIIIAVLIFLIDHHMQTKATERTAINKKNSDLVSLLNGLSMFSLPSYAMIIIFVLGGNITDVYICSALSIAGIIFWLWYKRSFIKPKISNSEIYYVRAYTTILIVISILSAVLFVSEIFSPGHMNIGKKNLSIAMLVMPIYFVMALSSMIAVILRVRKSPYALFATQAASYLLIAWFPFGTLCFAYWYFRIRKKEISEETALST